MMIQAVLGNPHHPEYGVATIPFPIPRDQHAHCMELLEALEIGDAVKADCKVEKVDSFYAVLKRVEMLTVNASLRLPSACLAAARRRARSPATSWIWTATIRPTRWRMTATTVSVWLLFQRKNR